MRPLLVLAALAGAAAALAGCSQGPEEAPVTAAAPPEMVELDPVVLVEGTFQYHPPESGPFVALTAYSVVTQTAVNPCLFADEPYFNNRQLPLGRTAAGLVPASGNLSLTFSWTDADWIGQHVVAAIRPMGDGYFESDRIARGDTLVVPIRLPADPEDTTWDVWLCLNDEAGGWGSPDWQPGPFVGSFTANVVFTPDPVPAERLTQPAL